MLVLLLLNFEAIYSLSLVDWLYRPIFIGKAYIPNLPNLHLNCCRDVPDNLLISCLVLIWFYCPLKSRLGVNNFVIRVKKGLILCYKIDQAVGSIFLFEDDSWFLSGGFLFNCALDSSSFVKQGWRCFFKFCNTY
jgi:hypothetical protein